MLHRVQHTELLDTEGRLQLPNNLSFACVYRVLLGRTITVLSTLRGRLE